MNLEALRAALGLPETADEAAILAAVTANATAVASHAAQLGAIRAAVGAGAEAAPEIVLAAVQARVAGSTDVQKMASTITGLETQLALMQAQIGRKTAEAFVDGAIKAGKPLVALRDHYVERHIADPASVEKEVGVMMSIHAGGMTPAQMNASSPGNTEADLTAEDQVVIKRMNLDPKAFLENKRKRMTPVMDGRAA